MFGVDEVTVLITDEDMRAAEREQWDDGTNYLAVAPGVVFGYDRNERDEHDAQKARDRSRERSGGRARSRARWPTLHGLPDRA